MFVPNCDTENMNWHNCVISFMHLHSQVVWI